MKSLCKTILILTAAMLLLAACAAPPANTAAEDARVATSVHETTVAMQADNQGAPDPTATPEPPTEEPPAPTNTPEPTAEVPTNTSEPTAVPPTSTPIPDDGRVIFDPGATFATIRDQIEKNSTNEYLVNIQQGQMLSVYVESDGKTPVLAITAENGDEIVKASQGFTWYVTNVQKTQDFTIKVVSADFTSDYILHISTPIDVAFDAGATSKTYDGVLLAGNMIEYKAYALKDQKANITLTSTSGQATLYIYGLGEFEEYVGYGDNATSWQVTLPASQVYLIKVIANSADTLYTLTIEFTD